MAASTSSPATMAASPVSDPSEFTLISSDNRRFFIPSTAAALSAVITRKLGDKVWPGNVVVLQHHDGKALEPVAAYLRGNGRARDDEEMKRRFHFAFLSGDKQSVDRVYNTGQALEMPGLVDLVSEKISGSSAGRITSRVADWVREPFQENDPMSDEEIQREELPIPTEVPNLQGLALDELQSAASSSSSGNVFKIDDI